MKRENSIITEILLNVEKGNFQYGEKIQIRGIPSDVCGKHIALIIEDGLAEGKVFTKWRKGIVSGTIYRLTSKGHDYCEKNTPKKNAKKQTKVRKEQFKPDLDIEWLRHIAKYINIKNVCDTAGVSKDIIGNAITGRTKSIKHEELVKIYSQIASLLTK